MFSIFSRLLNAKAHAYSIYEEFGPKRMVDRKSRLSTKFPNQSLETIDSWIEEFQAVNKHVWLLAEAGGTAHNNRTNLVKSLQEKFPWLDGNGLRTAMFLIDYYAHHEGYDEKPKNNLTNP